MKQALIIVDMQNDFINGAYPVPRAQEIIAPIQDLMAAYNGLVVLTACMHPKNHCSFKSAGRAAPRTLCHRYPTARCCKAGISALRRQADFILFGKGVHPDVEQLSGFGNPDLHAYLERHNVRSVEICGLARDYCVAATAADAEKLGYKVTILEELTRKFHV